MHNTDHKPRIKHKMHNAEHTLKIKKDYKDHRMYDTHTSIENKTKQNNCSAVLRIYTRTIKCVLLLFDSEDNIQI